MNKNNATKSLQNDQRLIDAKVPLPQLAQELGNIQKASDAHVEVSCPGELICQDLYFVDRIKGVGKVYYMQSAVDCYNSFGFAKLLFKACFKLSSWSFGHLAFLL